MSYTHVVRNKPTTGKRRVKELNSGLEFDSIAEAAKYFDLTPGTVRKYADGRSKMPQRNNLIFEWVKEKE